MYTQPARRGEMGGGAHECDRGCETNNPYFCEKNIYPFYTVQVELLELLIANDNFR